MAIWIDQIAAPKLNPSLPNPSLNDETAPDECREAVSFGAKALMAQLPPLAAPLVSGRARPMARARRAISPKGGGPYAETPGAPLCSAVPRSGGQCFPDQPAAVFHAVKRDEAAHARPLVGTQQCLV